MGNVLTIDELQAALHDSIEAGDIKGIQRCIRKGADVNKLVVREALRRPNRAKIEETEKKLTEKEDNLTIIAEGEKRDKEEQPEDKKGKRKRIKVNALHTAAKRKGNLKALQFILKCIDNVDGQDSLGNTALHYASSFYNNTEALSLILRSSPKVNLQNNYGETALFIATSYGCDMKIVEKLLTNDADPNIPNREGDTPLHACALWRGVDPLIPGILLRFGANPNLRNKYGQTPLHVAAESANNSVLLLLKYNAKVRLKDNNGNKPSEVASSDDIQRILREEEEDGLEKKTRSPNVLAAEGYITPVYRSTQEQSVHSWMGSNEDLANDNKLGIRTPYRRSSITSDASGYSGRASRWSYGSFYNKFIGGGGNGMLHLPNGKEIVIPPDAIPLGTSLELTLKTDVDEAKLVVFENMEFEFDIKIQLPGTAFLATWMREMRIREAYTTSPYFTSLCWDGDTSWKSARELTDDPGSDINLNFSLKKINSDPLLKQIPETTIEIKETDSLSSESEESGQEESEAGDREDGNFLDTEVSIHHHPPPEMDEEIFEMYRDCVREFRDNGRIQHPIDPALATIKEEDAQCNETNHSSQEDAFYATAEEPSSADEEFFANTLSNHEELGGTKMAVPTSKNENDCSKNGHIDESGEMSPSIFHDASHFDLNSEDDKDPTDQKSNNNKFAPRDGVSACEAKGPDEIVAVSNELL